MKINLQLPGTDPYTAPYVETLTINGEYDVVSHTINFKAAPELIEDLVKRAKAAGLDIYISHKY